jgi:hypothetical protein
VSFKPSHNGDTLGQHTDFLAIPAQQFALIVLTNSQGGGSLAATAALDAALAQFPALTPLVGKLGLTHALPTVTLSADDLTAYAGRYADPDEVLTFARSGDGLLLQQRGLHPPRTTDRGRRRHGLQRRHGQSVARTADRTPFAGRDHDTGPRRRPSRKWLVARQQCSCMIRSGNSKRLLSRTMKQLRSYSSMSQGGGKRLIVHCFPRLDQSCASS